MVNLEVAKDQAVVSWMQLQGCEEGGFGINAGGRIVYVAEEKWGVKRWDCDSCGEREDS